MPLLLQPQTKSSRTSLRQHGRSSAIAFVLGVSVLAFAVLGYHPYAEDGGIYAAALASRMDPRLLRHDSAWVTGHTRFSLFVPVLAETFRALHLSLATALLTLQCAGIVATVAALLCLAFACFHSRATAYWATLLVAVSAGLPVAGTSLYLMDPYPTARSVSTPLLLFAVTAALACRWRRTMLLWAIAAAVHPLMSLWGALPLLLLWSLQRSNRADRWNVLRRTGLLLGGTVLLAGAVWLGSPPLDSTALSLANTRGYWFLSQWRWFEIAGAVVPLLLLAAALRWTAVRRGWSSDAEPLAWAAGLSAGCGLLLALLFAHRSGLTMVIASTQPMRTLHLFYAVFLLLIAGTVANFLKQHRSLSLLSAAVAIAVLMVCTQRSLYPASGSFELPGRLPKNQWAQAFCWARDHTPVDALFALDANYTGLPGEDVQGFRAIALRSVLPDRAKDAGIAAVVSSLTPAWRQGTHAVTGLNGMTDGERTARLLPLGVTWLVLPASSQTALLCPYRNGAAKVCRLR